VTGAKVGVDFLLNAGEDSPDDNLEACCQGPKRFFLFHHLLKAAQPPRPTTSEAQAEATHVEKQKPQAMLPGASTVDPTTLHSVLYKDTCKHNSFARRRYSSTSLKQKRL